MPAQVTNYKCPACTGPLHFESGTGRLECEYCGSAFSVQEIERLYAAKDEKAAEAMKREEAKPAEDVEWGAGAGMKSYSCPSCGAELVCDENTAATCCPYCGNPTIVPGQFSGSQKPEYVIPFKLDREAAVAALKKHYKGKFFLPRSFADSNHIENVQGVYVPFWLYDGDAEATCVYEAEKKRVTETEREIITRVEHFHVERSGGAAFRLVPVDASSKMPDSHMDAIEPFDYRELVPFSGAYLPGYLADKFDVSQKESAGRAEERCRKSMLDILERSVKGYDSVSLKHWHAEIKNPVFHYAMLPVWLLNTKWQGKDYLFAMNGQTGKLIGDLPLDKKKFWLTFAAIALGTTALLSLLMLVL